MASRYVPLEGVRVIGFTGAARHGKDAAARCLLRRVPGAERFAFSDAIAALVRARGRMAWPRDPGVLQRAGHAGRQARPSAWLDALYGAIADRAPDLAIVTGVRFEDEAALVRDMGGAIVRVVRQTADGAPFVASDRDMAHPVELAHAAIRADYTIHARSLEALEAQVDRLVGVLCGGR